MSDPPKLVVIAGPNGAGKTTITEELQRQGRLRMVPVINSDVIARRLTPEAVERAAFAAGREARREVERHISEGKSFAVETTLAGNSPLKTIEDARGSGFRVELVLVGVESPLESKKRVEARVEAGGHSVPPGDVERRWQRSMDNLPRVLVGVERAEVYDNSTPCGHIKVLEVERGVVRQASPRYPGWLIRALGVELRPGDDVSRLREE